MIESANKDFKKIIINILGMPKDLKENRNRMRREMKAFQRLKKYKILNEKFSEWDLYQIKHCGRRKKTVNTNIW